GAAIGDHYKVVVRVSGFEQCGEHDAAGGNPEQDQGIDFLRTKYEFEVSAGEGADAAFADDHLVAFGCDSGVEFAGLSLEDRLVLRVPLDGAENEVARTQLGKIRAEANP